MSGCRPPYQILAEHCKETDQWASRFDGFLEELFSRSAVVIAGESSRPISNLVRSGENAWKELNSNVNELFRRTSRQGTLGPRSPYQVYPAMPEDQLSRTLNSLAVDLYHRMCDLEANPPPPPIPPIVFVTPATLPNGTVGIPFTATIVTNGGQAPVTFAVTAGALPPGLTLNATTGVISGTPTQAGTFTFTITATDANGVTSSQTFTITISPPALVIVTTTLPAGQQGVAYNGALVATGGTPPYTWAVVNGNLPPGVTLNADGSLTGTPTQQGVFNFRVRVTDSAGATQEQQLQLRINVPAPVFPNPFITLFNRTNQVVASSTFTPTFRTIGIFSSNDGRQYDGPLRLVWDFRGVVTGPNLPAYLHSVSMTWQNPVQVIIVAGRAGVLAGFGTPPASIPSLGSSGTIDGIGPPPISRAINGATFDAFGWDGGQAGQGWVAPMTYRFA